MKVVYNKNTNLVKVQLWWKSNYYLLNEAVEIKTIHYIVLLANSLLFCTTSQLTFLLY